jgi:hypothetical protein
MTKPKTHRRCADGRVTEVRPPRYTRFLVHFPNGAEIESWVTRPGATKRQIELEHPLARIEPVAESLTPEFTEE